MATPLWFVILIKKTFSQIFFLAKLTHVPGIGRLIERGLFEGDDIMYLPGDRVVRVNRDLNGIGSMVVPSQVVEHFIQEANYHWIMDFCICRDACRCKDYPLGLGCLFLGEAVLGINPRLGRLVSQNEALEHVARCREAGLVHLIGRNKLDSVWLNVRPGQKLLTICNCCPCCCLWRILPGTAPRISSKITRMPGVTVFVTEKCQGCGTCTHAVCFVNSLHLVEGRAVIGGDCRGCGRCVSTCPNGAIEMKVEDQNFINQSIDRIGKVVDVR